MSSLIKDAEQIRKLMDERIVSSSGRGKTFSMQVCPDPFILDSDEFNGFGSRYNTIKRFMSISEKILKKSFGNKSLDFILKFFLGEVDQATVEYHKQYYDSNRDYTPLFFRTDEPVPGRIVEIQSPGSGLATLGELQKVWAEARGLHFPGWDTQMVSMLEQICGRMPRILYIPFSSFQDDRIIFEKLTEQQGVEYIDPANAKLEDFDFVRTHSFDNLSYNNLFNHIMIRFFQGNCIIDSPPTLSYNQKIAMALPFDYRTYHFYDDEIRGLFPKTMVVEPNLRIEAEGLMYSLEQFSNLPPSKRKYVLKYAGSDPFLGSGGRRVYNLSQMSKKNCLEALSQAEQNATQGVYWILQDLIEKKYSVPNVKDLKTIEYKNCCARFSGFYGLNGLITRGVCFRDSYKVAGSEKTALAVVVEG